MVLVATRLIFIDSMRFVFAYIVLFYSEIGMRASIVPFYTTVAVAAFPSIAPFNK